MLQPASSDGDNLGRRRRIRPQLDPGNLLRVAVTALVVGVTTTSVEVSYAVLVFSGDLAPYVASGIGLFLAGSLIAVLIGGAARSHAGLLTINQDVPAAIAAVMAAGIAGAMPAASGDERFLTVVAAIMMTSLITGLLFILQGYLRIGAFFRFLPYPVVGGFLAGSGWLLVQGGLAVMTGFRPELARLTALFQWEILVHWLPGVVLALAMLALTNRYRNPLFTPALIVGAALAFYLIILARGISLEEVRAGGWLLGPFPRGNLWRPLASQAVRNANWPAIVPQAGSIAAIVIVSTIGLLLNASGLELTLKRDIRLDRALLVNGAATLGSGLVGGLVSYPSLSQSTLANRLGGHSRLLGPVVAVVLGLVLVLGTSLVAWTPRMIAGGLLTFLGLSFLYEWVYQGWFRFSRIDFAIVLAILFSVAAIGFLEGVVLGLGLAIVLFVVNYSRVTVVKHSLSGAEYQSRVTRHHSQQRILSQYGHQIMLLQLQNFIFFGTANSLLNQIRQRLEAADLPRVHYVILDFRHVTGLDGTATLSFTKLIQLAQQKQVALVFTSSSSQAALPGKDDSVARFFAQLAAIEPATGAKTVSIFPDLDYGLEWCENQILQTVGEEIGGSGENLRSQLCALLPVDVDLDKLSTYLERLDVAAGHYVMRQGDPPDGLYFIEAGQVTAQTEEADRRPVRLETMGGGRVVGEIGFYLGQPRTAAVIADQPSTLYRLSLANLEKMERQDPELAFAFHKGIIRLIAERSTHLINTVSALQR